MKLVPVENEMIGRLVIKRSDSMIIRVDETKVTKFVLIDGIGESVTRYKVGDVVLAKKVNNMIFDAGAIWRPLIEASDVACYATELAPGELYMQTENATQYVPFDSDQAAKSLCAQAVERKSEAA